MPTISDKKQEKKPKPLKCPNCNNNLTVQINLEKSIFESATVECLKCNKLIKYKAEELK